jgi:hypothetical protein
VRARFPSGPSSAMTLANTDASTTIKAVTAHRQCPQPPGPGPPDRHDGARSDPISHRQWAWPQAGGVLLRDTAATTALAAGLDAEARSERLLERHVRERLPCLHYDSSKGTVQGSPIIPRQTPGIPTTRGHKDPDDGLMKRDLAPWGYARDRDREE